MRGMPPLQGRRQRRLLQADPQTRVREPPPGLPPMRPLCPPRPAQRRHIRPGAKWIPGWIPDGLNPDEPQLLLGTRKKRIPMWTEYQRHSVRTRKRNPGVEQEPIPEGSSSVFFRWQRLFDPPSRFFTPALSRKSSRPLIYIETNCLYL